MVKKVDEVELAKRLKGIEFKARHTLKKIEELREDLKRKE